MDVAKKNMDEQYKYCRVNLRAALTHYNTHNRKNAVSKVYILNTDMNVCILTLHYVDQKTRYRAKIVCKVRVLN